MRARSPFSRGAALGLVGIGALLFVAVLWLIGAGLNAGPANNGGSHGAGRGLAGYAALSALLDRQGWQVAQARSEAMLKGPGLVVLTPPAGAEGADIARIVTARRQIGPTIVITPKWRTTPFDKLPQEVPGAKPGWTALDGVAAPEWKGFLDDVTVSLGPLSGGRWKADAASGPLPDPRAVLSGHGPHLVPLIEGSSHEGPILAAFLEDGGHYPALDRIALVGGDPGDPDSGLYPLVIVFEPDLIDNYGMARRENALYALRLIEAVSEGAPRAVTFDLTLNGLARKPNLLTLAFTPPFLAATLCLLAAALIAAWRAFVRFGPARESGPALAFGKAALVANAGGLIRRGGRLHLLGPPYAALVRDRLARALALPRHADPEQTDAAIDRALQARAFVAGQPHSSVAGEASFSSLARALSAARRPAELLAAARRLHALDQIHALERTVTK